MSTVLDGVRVLDFGRYISAPYCASLLADLGAEVIRVEQVGGGVDRFVVPLAGEEGGATFLQTNRNKKSVTLDMSSAEGAQVMKDLIASADIVVVNLPPQSLVSMGLDYQSLKAIRPDIILSTIDAFGSGGPWSHRVGFDGVCQAMSGLCHMTGHPGDPQKAYGPWVDFAAGTFAALGAVSALLHRRQTGEGQHVESPMLLAALAPATTLLIEQAVLQVNRGPNGNRSQTGAPADMFRTTDGNIIVQVVSQSLFKRWARLVGKEDWIADPRFRDDAARVEHSAILCDVMAEWCATRTTDEALAELDKASLPAGPVLKPQEVLDHEHIRAIGAFQDINYPGMPTAAPVLVTPFRMSATPPEIRIGAPLPGEHTDEVLAGLGYGWDRISDLRNAGRI